MSHNYFIFNGHKCIKPVCLLVAWSKVYDDGLIDVQYHVYTGLKNGIVSCLDDYLFKSFIDKDYSWSAIPFDEKYAYQLGFTVSEVEV